MKILIVDDNAMSLNVLGSVLAQGGYEVERATDGRQAMEILRRGGYRLVISDWEMTGMDGIQLCQAIRSEDLLGYVYVILLTAHGSPEEKVRGLSAGADDFVTKPFDSRELLARVAAAERVLSLETRDVTIFAMARLAESRDPETGAHLERVRSYCRVLAQELAQAEKFQNEVTAEYIRLIYLTSPLHDIGKVGIPDAVLLKPGRLSDREFEIMKTHTLIGAQTLEAALAQFPGINFLQMARDIAAYHHERFDGTGYPHRIAGVRIPLCARITALADVYDALTSKRVYKDAFAHDVARGIIVADSGTHFDPDLVATFNRTEDSFIAIRQRFAEMSLAA